MTLDSNQYKHTVSHIPLRIITSAPKSPHRGYLFIFDSEELYRNFDQACERFSRQGYNTIYIFYNPYRSPEGPVPWEEDLTPDEPDFDRAAAAGIIERQREESVFDRILDSLSRHGLKGIFNAGVWTPQTWFRSHPNAISRLPDQTPQYDRNFLRDGAHVYNPCFRSEEFLAHTRDSICAWLKAYATNHDFDAVLCRIAPYEGGALCLSNKGAPLFIEHQDTHDRDWCHCERCEREFREYIQHRLHDGLSLSSIGVSGHDISVVRLPLSPGVDPREPFADRQIPCTPEGERLWYEASQFWTMGVSNWAKLIRDTLREFYPDAELATISKYPVCRPLTDYTKVGQNNKVFLMDSYPMESGMSWNMLRYLFDIEIYQSAAENAGQALMVHAQAFDNPRPGHISRPPTASEYLQQFVGCMARGAAAVVDLAMNHAIDLHDGKISLLPDREVDNTARRRQALISKLEQINNNTQCYRKGIMLRYHLPSLCGTDAPKSESQNGYPGYRPNRAEHLLDEYRAWKQRGVPVCVVWDEQRSGPIIPDQFEFYLEGSDTSDYDLFIRTGYNRYIVSLINLRSESRNAEMAILLDGQIMSDWQVGAMIGEDVESFLSGGVLHVRCALPGLAWTVFEIRPYGRHKCNC